MNLLPIKQVAPLIGREVWTTRELCRTGKLRHVQDRCGRYWSSQEWADEFMGRTVPPAGKVDGMAAMEEALR